MKRFSLLTLVALFVAATGLAQDGPRRLSNLKATPLGTTEGHSQTGRRAAAMTFGEVLQSQKAPQLPKTPQTTAWQMRSPLRASIINTQPEGQYMLLNRSGEAYGYTIFGVIYAQVSGKVCEVVMGANNKVYMRNIITQYETGAWVEGTLSGSTITVTLP